MSFVQGESVMTATSDPFVENRTGEIAEVLDDDLYLFADRGLRLILHASELVSEEPPMRYLFGPCPHGRNRMLYHCPDCEVAEAAMAQHARLASAIDRFSDILERLAR